MLPFVSKRLEDGHLLCFGEIQKRFAEQALAMSVQPTDSQAHGILLFGVMRNHEVHKLGDARLLCTRSGIAGNNQFRKTFHDGVFGKRKKERLITLRPN